MKTILVPTDFTDHANYALGVAGTISKKTNAKVILLHILDRPVFASEDPYTNYYNLPVNLSPSSTLKKLQELAKEYQLANFECIEECRYDVHNTIIKHAVRHSADLIVMGAYGSSGSKEQYIGSNTERVMRVCYTPVLIIKQPYEEFDIENMVFASAFHEEVYKAFPKILEFGRLFRAKIHLLKVITSGRFQRSSDCHNIIKAFSNHFELDDSPIHVFNDLTIEDGIINFSEQLKADLVAITTHGKRRLFHLVGKNITDQITKNSVKSILSVRINKAPPSPEELYAELQLQKLNESEFSWN